MMRFQWTYTTTEGRVMEFYAKDQADAIRVLKAHGWLYIDTLRLSSRANIEPAEIK